jgi:hypothetical protein
MVVTTFGEVSQDFYILIALQHTCFGRLEGYLYLPQGEYSHYTSARPFCTLLIIDEYPFDPFVRVQWLTTTTILELAVSNHWGTLM